MSDILTKTSVPVFSIENISSFPLNPYRLYVYHCATTIFNSLQNKLNMSMVDFYNKSKEEQEEVFKSAFAAYPKVQIVFSDKPLHKRIFSQFDIINDGELLCTVMFFTHMTYITGNNALQEDDKEYVACEIDFTKYSGFDFTGTDRRSNVVDFVKSDTDTEVLDMIFANIIGLIEFTEFVKAYKAKQLIIKNINLFCDKLVTPYVQDIQTAFSPNEFIIGVICGENIHKEHYSYDNYLNSVKDFSARIIEKYGDRYKVENEEKKKNNK